MKLPFLEFLNLSYNKIKNIKPLGEINSKKLKYLFIQNNQIDNLEDIQFLCECDYPNLKILRLENNIIDEDSESLKKIIEECLKKKRIIVTNKKIDEIKNKYNIQYYNEKSEKIELEGIEEEEIELIDKEEEDEADELLLKNLFIIISQKNENGIKTLKLTNCKIKNPSILTRIQFDSLETLDLSNNNIKNLTFLKGMKAKYLKNLFLNENDICDLSLLYNLKDKTLFPDLELITLEDKKIDPNDKDKEELKNYLASYGIQIQLEEKNK
jgi:Leucine-rich repeat (LRR) protein